MTNKKAAGCGSVVSDVVSRWRGWLSGSFQAAVDALLFHPQKYCVAPRLGDLVVERRLRARLRLSMRRQFGRGLRPIAEQVRHEY